MKPEKKNEKSKKREKAPKKKENKIFVFTIVAVVIVLGAYFLLAGGNSQKTEVKKSMTLKEVRALIDTQYGNRAPGTDTPPVKDNYIPIFSPRKADKLPDFAVTNAMTLKAYTYATEHPEVLEQIPCYCGCGQHGSEASEGRPHRFVRDCFVTDKGVYDDHASFCDVCIGIAMKAATNLPDGIVMSGLTPGQATQTQQADLSALSLPENFRSIADGLKLTPAGITKAYFINTKLIAGTDMESQLMQQVEPDGFYGKKVIGMYSADYSVGSWIELHDLGYDQRTDSSVKAVVEPDKKNVVNTRPLIYGHTQNVDNVLKLMNDPSSMENSYSTFKPLLDAVDYQNAAYTLVVETKYNFSDLNYMGLTRTGDTLELIKAFHISDAKSIPSGLNKYNPETKGDVLIIKLTGDFKTLISENDNIDAAART